MCSNLVLGYTSIVGDDVHWCSIDCNVYDVSSSLVPASIICSLHDVVHEYLDVGYGSIEGQLERSYGFLVDGNVGLVGLIQD